MCPSVSPLRLECQPPQHVLEEEGLTQQNRNELITGKMRRSRVRTVSTPLFRPLSSSVSETLCSFPSNQKDPPCDEVV